MDRGLSFSSDEPISNRADDLFGRAKYADDIAHMLCSSSLNSSSFAVGLYGPWGSGKTSVVNLVVDSIQRKTNSVLVMRFEPWNYLSTGQLIEQFFDELSHLIEIKLPSGTSNEVVESISGYAQALLSSGAVLAAGSDPVLVSGALAVSQGIALFSRLRKKKKTEELTIAARKTKLIKQMNKLDMRVVVFVDDIDRLPNEQIRMLFQLVTSLANLPKVTYFLSFDEDVVIRALSSVQSCDGGEYLEKIIQIPLRLPNPSSVELRRFLFQGLQELGALYGFDPEHADTRRWICIRDEVVSRDIKTLRQAKRYLNALRAKLLLCGSSVSFLDIVVLVNIELCEPSLVAWIVANRESLWGSAGSRISSGASQGQIKDHMLEGFKKEFPGARAEKILDLICILFPRVALDTGKVALYFERKGDLNGIWRPDSFGMYFETNAGVGIAVDDVFAICNELDIDGIQALLNRYLGDNKAFRLISAITEFIPDLSSERLSIVCAALLSFLGQSRENDIQAYRNISVNELIVRSCESCLERLGVEQSDAIATDALIAGGPRVAFCFSLELSWQLNLLESKGNGRHVQLFSESCLHALCEKVCDLAERANRDGDFYSYADNKYALKLYQRVRSSEYKTFALELISHDDFSFIQFISDSCTGWTSLDGRPTSFNYDRSAYEAIMPLEEFRKRIGEICSGEDFAKYSQSVQLNAVSFLMFCEDPEKNAEVDVRDAASRLADFL